MTLRIRYLLYIVAIHVALIGLSFMVLRQNKVWFIASEVLIGASLIVAVWLYRAFQQPAQLIKSGIESIRDKDFTIKFVPTGYAEVDTLIHVYNLMIDQLRLERTRQVEQQLFLERLIEAAPIALIVLDFDARISAINPKARQLVRIPDDALMGKPLADSGHPLLTQLGTLPPGQSQTLKGPGAETYRVVSGQFIDRGFHRQFLFLDESTAEIVETEKRAYGKVIRMMAHEVNNSIGAVNSILHLTEPNVPDPDLQRAVRVAIDRNDRLNGFMRRFADVVRLPPPHLTRTDLTTLVRAVGQLMQPQADGRAVQLRLAIPDAPIWWQADAGQLEQVLVNVVKNALEACKAGHEVVLHLAERTLQVRNNGQPIADAVAAKLFDPFYSTKPTGQGIGLTLTREILLNHGFAFSLQTQADGWTVFRIDR